MIYFLSQLVLAFLLIPNVEASSCVSQNNDPFFGELLKQFKSQNLDCKGINSHLTFDDGPNENTTGHILDELNKRNIKATFFISTTNLIASKPNVEEKEALVNRELNSGHIVASHGHEHNAYDLRIAGTKETGYSSTEREEQIEESEKLLNMATNGKFSKQPYKLFRFPYGRGASPSQKEIEEMERSKKFIFKGETYAEKLKEYRRISPALQQIAGHNFSHLGWNHDSNDSSLSMKMPSDDVLKKFVTSNIQELCNPNKAVKVSLFHDIKEVNTRAIPLILDLGMCLGVKFISAKEMLEHKDYLSDAGVFISSKSIAKAPVQSVDEISKLLKTINTPKKQCPEIAHNETPSNGCYSTYFKKTFQNCGGETSKCFEGKWYGASDPIIILNCGP